MKHTKPTLEAQIEWAEVLIKCDSGIAPAVLASLKELAAIKSQPVPVEPLTHVIVDGPDGKDYIGKLRKPLYPKSDIDSLQSALQVAQQERDESIRAIDKIQQVGLLHLGRAEKAEAKLAALRLELARLDGEIPYGN